MSEAGLSFLDTGGWLPTSCTSKMQSSDCRKAKTCTAACIVVPWLPAAPLLRHHAGWVTVGVGVTHSFEGAGFTVTLRLLGSLPHWVLSSLSHSECWVHCHTQCWVHYHTQSAGFTVTLSAGFTVTLRVLGSRSHSKLGSLSHSECWVHNHSQRAGFSITLSAGFTVTLLRVLGPLSHSVLGSLHVHSAGFTVTLRVHASNMQPELWKSAGKPVGLDVRVCLWHVTQTFQSLLTSGDYACSDMSATFDPLFRICDDYDRSDMSVTFDPDFSESATWWLWLFRYVCDIWPRLFRIYLVVIMIVQICRWHLTQLFPSLLSGDHDCSDVSGMWLRFLRVSWQPVMVSVSISLWHVTQTFQGLLAVTDYDNCC